MGRLIAGDPLDVCIEGCIIAGRCELLLCEICQAFAVERVLQMLEGQSIVEDISWYVMLGGCSSLKALDGAIDIPSVIAGPCLSASGAAEAIPAAADRAMIYWENFMLCRTMGIKVEFYERGGLLLCVEDMLIKGGGEDDYIYIEGG